MARQTKRLTARTVAALTKVGRHADGGNLYLMISNTSSGYSKRWTFLYAHNGKQREAGFGSAGAVTLAEARQKAAEYSSLLFRGIDPLAQKQAGRNAERRRKTFGQCADELLKSKSAQWRSPIHARQWRMTLDAYCKPIRDLPVDEIGTAAVLAVLKPLWATIPETASRLRGRIEAVLNYAKAHGLRSGENPAAWKGHLALILPKRQKAARGHHKAVPYRDVPAFIAKLRESETIPSLALEFVILTATRSGEVLGATWGEIDLEAKVWVVPGSRTKTGLEHRIPLPARAMGILEEMAAIRCSNFVFPGHRRGQGLGQAALWRVCPGAGTVHGFRSSFRDWAGDETSFPREVAEAALAHSIGNEAERAYRRGDALEKRRALMEAWSSFCDPSEAGNVISLRKTL